MVDGRDVEMTEFADAGVILVVKSSAARKPGELADGAEAEEPADVAKTHEPVTRSSRKAIVILISGVCQAQFGMIMFNLGLNFGFTSLGDQVGAGLCFSSAHPTLHPSFLAHPCLPTSFPTVYT